MCSRSEISETSNSKGNTHANSKNEVKRIIHFYRLRPAHGFGTISCTLADIQRQKTEAFQSIISHFEKIIIKDKRYKKALEFHLLSIMVVCIMNVVFGPKAKNEKDVAYLTFDIS